MERRAINISGIAINVRWSCSYQGERFFYVSVRGGQEGEVVLVHATHTIRTGQYWNNPAITPVEAKAAVLEFLRQEHADYVTWHNEWNASQKHGPFMSDPVQFPTYQL
jgi:hypothetical protein